MAGQKRLFTHADLLSWQSEALLREECRSLWRQRQQAKALDDREGVRRWGRKRRQVLAELRRRRGGEGKEGKNADGGPKAGSGHLG